MSGYGEVGLTRAFYCTELLGSPESNKKERRGKTGDIRWNDKSSYFTYLQSEDYPEFTFQFGFFLLSGTIHILFLTVDCVIFLVN